MINKIGKQWFQGLNISYLILCIITDAVGVEESPLDVHAKTPEEIIANIDASSIPNCKESLGIDSLMYLSVENAKFSQRQSTECLPSDVEMERQFELIRRRQSQYTPVPTPMSLTTQTTENIGKGTKRAPFCTSIEDGVEQ